MRRARHCRRLLVLAVAGWLTGGIAAVAWADLPHQVAGEASHVPVTSAWNRELGTDLAVDEVLLENQPPYSLDELLQIAQVNSPALAQAAARVRAARGNWVQVGLPPNPTAGYLGSEIGQEGTAGQQGGFVGQEFVTGGKLRLDRAVAAQQLREAEADWRAQWLRVANDTSVNFYNVLLAQRMVELADELVEIGNQGVRAAEDLLRAQEVSRVDLLQARVELNSARILLENARNRHDARWRQLAAVLGVPHLARTRLEGDPDEALPDIVWSEALEHLLSQSPELAAAQANLQRARWAVRRSQAEPIPNLDVQASVQHDNATGYDFASVQIGVPLPLWNRNQGGIDRARADARAAFENVRRVQLDLQVRLAATYERYANARQQVAIYRQEMIPDAATSLELIESGYRQGELQYVVLLTAQRTYYRTHLDYLESLQNLLESAVAIEGLLLTGSLEWRPD